MKLFMTLIWVLCILFPTHGICASADSQGDTSMNTKLRMTFGNHKVMIELFDTPASRDFVIQLPLTLQFSDFAGAEKIASLPRKLRTQGSPTAREVQGDFTYYAPWGNLALFYKGFGTDGQLYVLGRFISGKEHLATMRNAFSATISLEQF